MIHDTDHHCLAWVRGIALAHASLVLPDLNTHAHQVVITQLSIPFALNLGYSAHDAKVISVGCEVHDIGKIAVIPELRENQYKLLDRHSQPFETLKKHAEYGARFFEALLECVGQEHIMHKLMDICKYHHERWDGTGYYGLRGASIPALARLMCILDAFTAMTEPLRAYRKALTQAQAMDELQAYAGTQFDPTMIAVLLDLLQHTSLPA